MSTKNTSDALAPVHATEAKISEMEERVAGLKSRRAALSVDPTKDVEKQIAAKIKAEAAIDAELVPLELALEHLKGGVDQQLEDVQNVYLADVRVALEEARTMSENATAIGTAYLESHFPCEDKPEFRKVFKEPNSGTSPLLLKPLGHLTRWMRGVSEAVELFEGIDRLTRGYGRGSDNPTIPTQKSYISALCDFLDSYQARKGEVQAAVAEMEARFPKPATITASTVEPTVEPVTQAKSEAPGLPSIVSATERGEKAATV